MHVLRNGLNNSCSNGVLCWLLNKSFVSSLVRRPYELLSSLDTDRPSVICFPHFKIVSKIALPNGTTIRSRKIVIDTKIEVCTNKDPMVYSVQVLEINI